LKRRKEAGERLGGVVAVDGGLRDHLVELGLAVLFHPLMISALVSAIRETYLRINGRDHQTLELTFLPRIRTVSDEDQEGGIRTIPGPWNPA
jgi:hypothetical protein